MLATEFLDGYEPGLVVIDGEAWVPDPAPAQPHDDLTALEPGVVRMTDAELLNGYRIEDRSLNSYGMESLSVETVPDDAGARLADIRHLSAESRRRPARRQLLRSFS